MPNHYAVIGDPIDHSLSPVIHQYFAKQSGISLSYEKIQASPAAFESTVLRFFDQGGKGLNVTLPHKERAFQLAQVRSKRCQQAKAANTLWMQDGQLHADTTDGVGLVRDLSRYMALEGKLLLLLGAGGAAKSVMGELLEAGIAGLTIANRTVEKVQALQLDFPSIQICALSQIQGVFDLVINATSAGLVGEAFHLSTACLKPTTYCYDLIYNRNAATPFVQWARAQGCAAQDGLGMLVEQAAESFWIWHGARVETGALIKSRI